MPPQGTASQTGTCAHASHLCANPVAARRVSLHKLLNCVCNFCNFGPSSWRISRLPSVIHSERTLCNSRCAAGCQPVGIGVPCCQVVPGALPAVGRSFPTPWKDTSPGNGPRMCGGRLQGLPSKHSPFSLCKMSQGVVLSPPAWTCAPASWLSPSGMPGPKSKHAPLGACPHSAAASGRPLGVCSEPLEPSLC